MHPLTGIVVEYLVVGSTSALWILMLLARFDALPRRVPNVALAVLIPLLYVLGMLSDRLGRLLIERSKDKLEGKIRKETGHREVSTQDVSSRLIVCLPALAQQLEARRTRDRISRGVLANVPFLTLASAISLTGRAPKWTVILVVMGGALLYTAVWSMWQRFQILSSRYEIHCDKRLSEMKDRVSS
jgi:hypothetical protein